MEGDLPEAFFRVLVLVAATLEAPEASEEQGEARQEGGLAARQVEGVILEACPFPGLPPHHRIV